MNGGFIPRLISLRNINYIILFTYIDIHIKFIIFRFTYIGLRNVEECFSVDQSLLCCLLWADSFYFGELFYYILEI